MRAYFFGNMYLSSIQQGIQGAHVLGEMYTKYLPINLSTNSEAVFTVSEQAVTLTDWARNHKTMIFLNAGYSEEIRELLKLFVSPKNSYPWAEFNESTEALDGTLTCIGIILPERIYGAAAFIRKNGEDNLEMIRKFGGIAIENDNGSAIVNFTKWEYELLKKLNTYGMAK